MTKTRNILQRQWRTNDTTTKNWNIVTVIFMWGDGLQGKYSPPSVNCCFFKRSKIILLNLVQINQLLLFFFLWFFSSVNTYITRTCPAHTGTLSHLFTVTQVEWQVYFLFLGPQSLQKRRRNAGRVHLNELLVGLLQLLALTESSQHQAALSVTC